MIKLVMCLHRHPDMSRAQFHDYWKNQHAPLFQSFADTHHAIRYVQDHTIDSPVNDMLRESRGMVQEFDGVRLPTRMVQTMGPGMEQVLLVSDVKINSVDAEVFELPLEIKALLEPDVEEPASEEPAAEE